MPFALLPADTSIPAWIVARSGWLSGWNVALMPAALMPINGKWSGVMNACVYYVDKEMQEKTVLEQSARRGMTGRKAMLSPVVSLAQAP